MWLFDGGPRFSRNDTAATQVNSRIPELWTTNATRQPILAILCHTVGLRQARERYRVGDTFSNPYCVHPKGVRSSHASRPWLASRLRWQITTPGPRCCQRPLLVHLLFIANTPDSAGRVLPANALKAEYNPNHSRTHTSRHDLACLTGRPAPRREP